MDFEVKYGNHSPQIMENGVWYMLLYKPTNLIRIAQRQNFRNNFTGCDDLVIYLNNNGFLTYDSYDDRFIANYMVLQKVNKITIE